MENKQSYGDLLLLAKGGDLMIRKILVRLPVVSLGRFKSVCKSWYALIESSFFIDLHTTFNSSSSLIVLASLHHKYIPKPFQTSMEHSMILISSESESGDDSISRSGSVRCLWSTTGSDDQDDQQLVFKLNGLGFPKFCELSKSIDELGLPPSFKLCKFSKNIVGSCNGLLCLYDSILNEVSLWNPATKQHRILPKAIKIVEDDFPRRLVAFGFDVETKDYKVVLLTGLRSNKSYRSGAPSIECLCRVQVYSLSTDSWSFLENLTCLPGDPFFTHYPPEVVYLNGSCFFLANFFNAKQRRCIFQNDRFIISFDLSKYIITPIQLPIHDRRHKLFLSCLGDKMALFTACCKPLPTGDSYYPDNYELPSARANYSYYQPEIYEPPRGIYYGQICGCEDYNIWVLDDEHISSSSSSVNKKSWRQLHSFQIQHQRPGLWSSPSCISNDGEFVLLENMDIIGLGKRMKLYNLVTKEVKKDFLSCSRVLSKAYAYKPSLVKLTVGSSQQQPIG